ncbi:MAG: OmpA family protein [Phycisphaerales bacterium]|nr:MAG: OmpA family protein [Phycisphaerales bacterium]
MTFGDMMSLLLCFFILLQMFSELKKDHEYQRVVTAIKEAFGYAGGIGVLPVNDPPLKSIVEVMEAMAVEQDNQELNDSASPTKGIDGPQMRVKKIRDGIVFTIGGPSTFEPLSAELRPSVKSQIERLAVMLAGRNNKIVIRGHAAAKYLPEDSIWDDLDQLAFERARNVKNMLLEMGLDDRVFRLEVAGTREPVRPRAVAPPDAAENRRVEIILTEQLADELNADLYGTDVNLARGG